MDRMEKLRKVSEQLKEIANKTGALPDVVREARKALLSIEQKLEQGELMKRLIVLAVLVLNGQTYWTPCERGAVFCPHFDQTYTVLVSSDANRDVLYTAYEPAPSTVVEGVSQ